MSMNTLPITELRSLLSAVSSHGRQHLVEVEADLKQTTDLLSEAIEKLGASFLAVHEAVMKQQEAITTLMLEHHMQNGELETLDAYKQQIGDEVNAAVTGLQFQDMTSQLITRTIRRINGLRDLLEELSLHGKDIAPEQEHAEIAKFLGEMNFSLTRQSNALSGGLRKQVSQENMQTGDIELF
jgi:hypothetical protein